RVCEMSECENRVSVETWPWVICPVLVLLREPPPISFSISRPKLVRPPGPKRRAATSEPDQKLLVEDPLICVVTPCAPAPRRDAAMLPPTTNPEEPTGAKIENCGATL